MKPQTNFAENPDSGRHLQDNSRMSLHGSDLKPILTVPTPKRAFVSFDYDHDLDLKVLLVGQAKHSDTPFSIHDLSIKEAITEEWKEKARTRIKGCDVVIVICGENTDTATGVSAEITIAQDERVPYFLLKGRSNKTCKRPKAAYSTDKIYDWTWDNLKKLIHGQR